MKSVKRNASLRLLCLFAFSFSLHSVLAQDGLNKRPNVPIDDNCNGYLEYLPIGYTGGTQKYPLLIHIDGLGSTGDGSAAALENHFTGGGYPHEQQRQGIWPDAFTVNGQTFQLLIITPQFVADMWNHFPSPKEINDVIDYTIAHYRIDTTRIYISGCSQGGGSVWDYIGSTSLYANRIAAALPFSGVSFPFQEKADIIKHSPVAVWAFHNLYDDQVPSSFTIDYVDMINNQGAAPGIPAKKTIIPTTGHLSWFAPLMRTYTEDGLNVYQWLLQYQKHVTKAFAGEDQEIMLPANSVQLAATGTGPNGTVSSYSWQKISGPANGDVNNNSISNPSALNLEKGAYTFRVTITDNVGGTNYDDVAVTVNPGAQRIEAENYTNSFGIVAVHTDDGGGAGGTCVNAIDNFDWMDYNVTVPMAGTYRIRFRAGTFYGGTPFNVLDHTGATLATVTMYPTGGWDNYMNLYANIPLQAGTQTIRLQNVGTIPGNVWYINWFEVIDDPITLPVNFILFNTNCVNGNTEVLWKTAGEIDVANFTIEKSDDARTWNTIATIQPASQNGAEATYRYRDNTSPGQFYRVVEHDIDGKKTYGTVLKSSCSSKTAFEMFPNPVIDHAIVNISSDKTAELNLSVYDNKGSLVQTKNELLPAGSSQLSLDLPNLPKGSYTLVASWQNEKKSLRFVKQ